MTGAHALPPGLRLGDYEIVSPLTTGGMAAVYLGRRAGVADGPHVAIKVVHPKFADEPQFVQMFLDEARLSSRIHHPNVVRVEATGEADGLYYMVMEYLHGASLQIFVRRLAEKQRSLKVEVIVRIIAEVAAALHAAHETTDEQGKPLGIVHRDVTPQNILVSYGGGVKLIDFGIAKAAGRIHQTAKGLLKGKLRYMSPEQASGRAVDRRTDVYALGILLWELLTYRKAFSAKTDAELIRLVLDPKLPPPTRLNRSLPPELDGVTMTALAPKPEERFQTALAFRNALLGAYPAAQAVDEAQVSSLLRSVMADELARDERLLPKAVVVSAPRAVGTPAQQEAALTEMVESIVPDDEVPDRPPPPPEPPRPAARVQPASVAATAYGIGLAPPTPAAAPAPAAVPAVVPAVVPAGPAPTPGPVYVAPAPPSAGPVYDIAQTRLSPPSVEQGAPPPQPIPPAHAFTPPNATDRGAVAAQIASAGVQPPAATPGLPKARGTKPKSKPPPSTASRVGWGCAIALAAVLTVAVGVAIGWVALQQATQMSAPP